MRVTPLTLLKPHILSFKNTLKRTESAGYVRHVFLFLLGAGFWVACFFGTARVLGYFNTVEGIGEVLVFKFLSMVLISFFSILLFSSLITALGTFFLSDELPLILASPQPIGKVFYAKAIETTVLASWMIFTFSLPILAAFGWEMGAPAYFYPAVVFLWIPFLMISSGMGILAALCLVKAFPARRIQDIFFFLVALVIAGVYVLIRFLQPESLLNPGAFSEISLYIGAISTPASPYLPTTWITELIKGMMSGPFYTFHWFFFGMLVTTALSVWIIAEWVAVWIYRDGWSKAQEARRVLLTKGSILDVPAAYLYKTMPRSFGALLVKDIKIFLRSTAQWSQLLLLGALVIVYVYNFQILPTRISPLGSLLFQNVLAFLNLALCAFVLTAIAVRFVYPAVSLEGPAFWIIRTSPISLRQFWWSKFWMSVLPLVLLSELLVILTNYFLGVSKWMHLLSAATILGLCFGITSLGMLLGSRYPKFGTANPMQISMGFGGIVFMILSMGYAGLVVIIEAGPVYLWLTNAWGGRSSGTGLFAAMAGGLGLAFLIQIVFFWVTAKLGLRAIEVRMKEG